MFPRCEACKHTFRVYLLGGAGARGIERNTPAFRPTVQPQRPPKNSGASVAGLDSGRGSRLHLGRHQLTRAYSLPPTPAPQTPVLDDPESLAMPNLQRTGGVPQDCFG
jgi:hypothetical protein